MLSLVYTALSNGVAHRRPPDAQCRPSLVEAVESSSPLPAMLEVGGKTQASEGALSLSELTVKVTETSC